MRYRAGVVDSRCIAEVWNIRGRLSIKLNQVKSNETEFNTLFLNSINCSSIRISALQGRVSRCTLL